MTAFDFGIIGWVSRANDLMADTQPDQPQGKGAGKCIVTAGYQHRLPIGLDFVWQRAPTGKATTQNGTHLLQADPLNALLDFLGREDDRRQAGFTDWITHRMETHPRPIL
jgi:hypothetical protein